jgi:rhodanese-related sulfurtransferase
MVPTNRSTALSPAELARLIAGDASVRVLDVRTPGEFSTAHVHGAYNVPLDALPEHAAEIAAIHTPVVLICQSGQRARRAETALAASGMPYLHVLDGGMQAWMTAGQAVVRGTLRISLERQVRITAGAVVAIGALLALTVSEWVAVLPLLVGSGLVFSGVTDTCTMGRLLAQLPYNRVASCDATAMVRALRAGLAPDTGRGEPAGSRDTGR